MRDTTWSPPSRDARVDSSRQPVARRAAERAAPSPAAREPSAGSREPSADAAERHDVAAPGHDSDLRSALGPRPVALGWSETPWSAHTWPDESADDRPPGYPGGAVELPRPAPREPYDIRRHVLATVRVVGVTRIVAGLMAAGVLAAVGWWLLRPPPVPIEDSMPFASFPAASGAGGASADAGGQTSSATGSASGELLVHVAGAVRRPGVYRFVSGARVADAVDQAGGPSRRADLDRVNLAAPLVDGQQVMVPREGEPFDGPVGADGAPTPSGPVDLNTADAAALDALPGVGPATAAAIIAHRDENGPYATVEDLLDVPGIGPAKLDALRDLVTT